MTISSSLGPGRKSLLEKPSSQHVCVRSSPGCPKVRCRIIVTRWANPASSSAAPSFESAKANSYPNPSV